MLSNKITLKLILFTLLIHVPLFCDYATLSDWKDKSVEEMSLGEYLRHHTTKLPVKHFLSGGSNQPQFFYELLESHPEVKTIAQSGFLAGHSSELFLSSREDVQVVSFDEMKSKCTYVGNDYINLHFPERHQLIEGELSLTVPDYYKENPGFTFDLIFIDGGSSYEQVLADLKNFKNLAHKDTLIVINDLNHTPVKNAWEKSVEDGLITKGEVYKSKSKKWVLCNYNF